MNDWYDRAEAQLEDDLESGAITEKEFREEMRELNREYEQAAQDAAAEAYDNYYY